MNYISIRFNLHTTFFSVHAHADNRRYKFYADVKMASNTRTQFKNQCSFVSVVMNLLSILSVNIANASTQIPNHNQTNLNLTEIFCSCIYKFSIELNIVCFLLLLLATCVKGMLETPPFPSSTSGINSFIC